jgi:hypothetical protein
MGRSNISGVLNDFIKENTNQQYWALSIYGRKRRLEAVDAADARLIMVREYGPP